MSFKVLLQYLLPHHAFSRLVYTATRWRWRPWKNALIGRIVRRYRVDMDEAEQPDPRAYVHFNAFFTRALRAAARPVDTAPDSIVSPADGRISQLGRIEQGRIFQAKGHHYSTAELLADAHGATPYHDGAFVTVYLAPRDYHRVHMPLTGTLVATTHVPGRIFSVAPFAVQAIPRLFARNERLVCHFDGEHGPFAVVLVGAILVSSVSTVWGGLTIPPYAGAVTHQDHGAQGVTLQKGAEMGRFNMGSTVIVLLPDARTTWLEQLQPQSTVRVGQALGHGRSGTK